MLSPAWDSGGVHRGVGDPFLAAGTPQAADEKSMPGQGTEP
jgi:hypothetical protein